MPAPNRTDEVEGWINDVETFPGRTITLEISAARVAYLRYLLFRDLQEEAETIANEAHRAHELGEPGDGYDAESSVSIMGVTTGILDLIGWDTGQDQGAIKWLEGQEREGR